MVKANRWMDVAYYNLTVSLTGLRLSYAQIFLERNRHPSTHSDLEPLQKSIIV